MDPASQSASPQDGDPVDQPVSATGLSENRHMPAFSGSTLTLLTALILLGSLSWMTYRLLHTQRMDGDRPTVMLSANDRSRWVTIRSLLERGSFEIENYTTDPELASDWNTIDKVMHLGRDGRMHQYSSKPPLLATMLTAPVRLIQSITGWNFNSELPSLVRTTLWCVQILPLLLTLTYFATVLRKLPLSPGVQLFVLATAATGTFVTTFAVSLNNHHFAVLSVYWALISLLQILWLGQRHFFWFLIAGLSAGFAAANELPALSFFCVVLLACLVIDLRLFLRATLPAAAVVGFAFFATNMIAHQSLRPPYAHRSDGPILLEIPDQQVQAWRDDSFLSPDSRAYLNQHADQLGFALTEGSGTTVSRFPLKKGVAKRWVIRDYFLFPWNNSQWRALAVTLPEGGQQWQIRSWDNWYDYPGSYWLDGARSGVDVGEPNAALYAFHCLVGHHGIFSLTPVWLLSLAGCLLALRSDRKWQGMAMAILGLSVVVIGFYLMRPQLDRNYGGQCSALRWVFWLSPLWIFSMIPALQKLFQSRWGIGLSLVLLAASVVSAAQTAYNPWVHPWLYQLKSVPMEWMPRQH